MKVSFQPNPPHRQIRTFRKLLLEKGFEQLPFTDGSRPLAKEEFLFEHDSGEVVVFYYEEDSTITMSSNVYEEFLKDTIVYIWKFSTKTNSGKYSGKLF